MRFDHMNRREVITLLGGAAAWPLAARAQQRERIRRIGVLINFASDDPAAQSRLTAFLQGLALAAHWLLDDHLDGCLVIGTEESDWLTADAYRLFDRRAILAECCDQSRDCRCLVVVAFAPNIDQPPAGGALRQCHSRRVSTRKA